MEENIGVENVPPGSSDVTDDDKLWALLGYIVPIIALIALLIEEKKDRRFVKYHAVQALVLGVISLILNATICGGLLVWFYAIYVGFMAYQGQWVTVPIVTDFCKDQGWIS